MASLLDRRETLACLAGALAWPGFSAAAPLPGAGPLEIGLSEVRSRFMLPVGLEGPGDFSFVFDTGSPAHVVSQTVATKMNLPVVGRRRLRSHAGGDGVSPVVRVERFFIGGVPLGPANLVVWPDAQLEGHSGLVGYPLLDDGAVLSLAAGKIALRPSAEAGTAVRAEIGRSGMVLLGGLPDADGRFAFDTGAQALTISPAYHERIRDNPAYLAAPKIVTRGQAPRVLGFRPAVLRFGDLVCTDPLVQIAQSDDDRLAAFEGVDGLAGVGLLRRYVWAVDPAAKKLSVLSEVFFRPTAIPAEGGPSPLGGVSFGAPVFEPGPAK